MGKKFEIEGGAYWGHWLRQWRLWLLGALIGALAAFALYALFPPDYRAKATVVVDQNAEEAWTFFPDRQLFQFLNRESNRLLALAWSDEVLSEVAESANISVQDLRASYLDLSQPADGGWHFMASHPDAALAGAMADQWSHSFIEEVETSIDASPALLAARDALELKLAEDPDPEDPELLALLVDVMARAEESRGISPFVELYLSEEAAIPSSRAVSQPTYLVIGALAGLLLALLYSLISSSKLQED